MEIQNLVYLGTLTILLILAVVMIAKITNDLLFEIKYILPAVAFSAIIFLMINIRLAELKVFVYNPNYLSGINWLQYPAEEWLLLPVVSMLSFAAYLFAKKRLTSFEKPNLFVIISLILLVISGLITWFSRQKIYPFSLFMLFTIYLGYTVFRNRFKQHLTSFYLAFMIMIIPFFVLRAVVFSSQVIIPDNNYLIGISLVNMPVEEFAFLFLLMLINITIYEYLRERRLF